MDFFGPIPYENELLVLMDKFSRMPVVEEVKTTAADFVLPKLDTICSLLGIPEDLETDNCPPFNGVKFSEFCKYYGINHRKITPYHPPANSQPENFMKNMAKVIKTRLLKEKIVSKN
jgi:transposase InsO family protein